MGRIFVFVGTIFITISTALVCFILVAYAEPFYSNLYSPFFPTFASGFLGFIIGNMFNSVFGISMDTLMICSIIDEEIMSRAKLEPFYQSDKFKE